MNLRTYHAPSIADALGKIKHDLGPDAVILHTRSYKRGGFLGFGARKAVEITASSAVNVLHPLARKGKASADQVARRGADRLRRAYAYDAGEKHKPAQQHNEHALGSVAPVALAPGASSIAAKEVASAVISAATVQAIDPDSLRTEIASIKNLVTQVLRSSRSTGPALPAELSAMYLRMIEEEVAAEIADRVISEVRDELNADELAQPEIVRARVLRRLARQIPVAKNVALPGRMPDGRPLTIALIGPTGVGKTTTIAKLAAAYKLKHGKKVGLVTCDTYRIAAVEQLRTYANIIGLQLNVALTPPEMSSCCAAMHDCDVILIDTAGRSPNDNDRLCELAALLKSADPHETHLVLSSASCESVLARAAQRFSVASPNRVILTKLDETVSFGVLVNIAQTVGQSLSYITTGQEVPDHIEPGRPERIAQMVLDGGGVR